MSDSLPKNAGLRGADSLAARWFIEQLFLLPWLAHHPTCRCFDNHLLRIGTIAVCLGCTCMALGASTGSVVLGWLCWSHWSALELVGTWGFVAIGLALFTPTIAQPFLQQKMLKMVSRFMLGLAVPCLWLGAMALLPWDWSGAILRVVFLIVFWITFVATQWFRAYFTSNPCENCSQGVFPFCTDNRDRLVALVEELRIRAGPEDQEFVDFAEGLAGIKDSGAKIQIVSLTMLNKDLV